MTCWRRLRDWTEAGVWPALHELLLDQLRALGDAAAWPVQGLIRHFRHVIEARIDRYAANPDHAGAIRAIAAE